MNTFVYLYLCYESHNSSNLHENTENMLQNKYYKTQYKSSLFIMILNTDIQLPDQTTPKLNTKSGEIEQDKFNLRSIKKTGSSCFSELRVESQDLELVLHVVVMISGYVPRTGCP